jgi:uncharacterized protein (UPF0303 family)
MSNNNYLVVKDKVQRFAKQLFNTVQLNDDGSLSVPYESTHVFIEIFDMTSDDADFNAWRKENDLSFTTVSIWAMVVMDVKPSNELYKWVAIDGQDYNLGGFKLVMLEDGLVNIIYRTAISGDNLDAGELKGALLAVATTADETDEMLKSRFGGKVVEDIRN